MKIAISHSNADIRLIREYCRVRRNKRVVKFRRNKNLRKNKPPIDKERFWRALVCMRLTSRQRSGPGGAVSNLISMKPFPLTVKKLRMKKGSLKSFISSELRAIRGMRDYDVAARQLARNFQLLEKGGWEKYLGICNDLRSASSVKSERSASNSIADAFEGIGPKQSRNFLQALGLTRYEIPLDSRVMKWLRNELKFPLPISSALFVDKEYYEFVLDQIQVLCRGANVLPCILDAAIFSDGDNDSDWTVAMMDF